MTISTSLEQKRPNIFLLLQPMKAPPTIMNIHIKVLLHLELIISIINSICIREYTVAKFISIDMTVATKDALQDLTAEETTKPFTQSNSSLGEELKMQTGLLEGKG